MRAKYLILISLILTICSSAKADNGEFYIYGKCTLVQDEELEGFLCIKGDRLWISQFITTKLNNPYAKLFANNGTVYFGEDRNSNPSVHSFICRYNDIKQLRPIAKNRLEITIKNNSSIDVVHDFDSELMIQLPNGKSRRLRWENIANIKFMGAPNINPINYPKLYVGSVESTQGTYFGIIEGLNYSNKTIPIADIIQDTDPKITFDEIDRLECKSDRRVDITIGDTKLDARNFRIKQTLATVRITLPTMGSIDVPWDKVKSITKFALSEFNGETYESSIYPKRLNASVTLNYKQKSTTRSEDSSDIKSEYQVHKGPIAYDLDEALNIEFIEGRNDGIYYRLVLDKIASIEPRNYNYSLIQLKNGSRLSLGSDQDVSFKNDGILMLNTKIYIQWRYIDTIQFND